MVSSTPQPLQHWSSKHCCSVYSQAPVPARSCADAMQHTANTTLDRNLTAIKQDEAPDLVNPLIDAFITRHSGALSQPALAPAAAAAAAAMRERRG